MAAAHAKTLAHQREAACAALTGGFQWALWVCGAIALLAIPVTRVLVRSDDLAEATQVAPATNRFSTRQPRDDDTNPTPDER